VDGRKQTNGIDKGQLLKSRVHRILVRDSVATACCTPHAISRSPVLRKKSVRGYSSREILLMSKGLPFLVRLWHPAALCESFLPYCP